MAIRDKRIWMLVMIGALVFGFAAGALAQEQATMDAAMGEDEQSLRRERWQQMSPEQQEIMRRRLKKFKNLPVEERRDLQRRVRHFEQLPRERKERLRERWQRFERLSPQEKQEFKKHFQEWKKMSPQERERIQEYREKFYELTPERRKELKEKREQWRQNRQLPEYRKFLRGQPDGDSTGQMKLQQLPPGHRPDRDPAFQRQIKRSTAPVSSGR